MDRLVHPQIQVEPVELRKLRCRFTDCEFDMLACQGTDLTFDRKQGLILVTLTQPSRDFPATCTWHFSSVGKADGSHQAL